jgi:hypothetical protein
LVLVLWRVELVGSPECAAMGLGVASVLGAGERGGEEERI